MPRALSRLEAHEQIKFQHVPNAQPLLLVDRDIRLPARPKISAEKPIQSQRQRRDQHESGHHMNKSHARHHERGAPRGKHQRAVHVEPGERQRNEREEHQPVRNPHRLLPNVGAYQLVFWQTTQSRRWRNTLSHKFRHEHPLHPGAALHYKARDAGMSLATISREVLRAQPNRCHGQFRVGLR